MNTPDGWQDEHIHAFVDGELDAATARQLESDSRTDATLAARIESQRQLARLLRARFDPVLEEAVPARLQSTLDVVVPLVAARPAGRVSPGARGGWSSREWGAMAASVLVGAVGALLLSRHGSDLPLEMQDGRLVARGALQEALDRELSGSAKADAPVRVLLTVRTSGDQPCRAFILRVGGNSAGLACRQAGRWQVELLEGTGPGAGEGYRQAGSALSPVLRGALEARAAGEPLEPGEESGLLARGWDAPRP